MGMFFKALMLEDIKNTKAKCFIYIALLFPGLTLPEFHKGGCSFLYFADGK